MVTKAFGEGRVMVRGGVSINGQTGPVIIGGNLSAEINQDKIV